MPFKGNSFFYRENTPPKSSVQKCNEHRQSQQIAIKPNYTAEEKESRQCVNRTAGPYVYRLPGNKERQYRRYENADQHHAQKDGRKEITQE